MKISDFNFSYRKWDKYNYTILSITPKGNPHADVPVKINCTTLAEGKKKALEQYQLVRSA